MFDTIDELLSQIGLGEDSTLDVKNLEFRENQVTCQDRNSMADEPAAMANTTTGVFIREDIPQFKMHAVFEAITSAVAHRDYSISGSKIQLHLFNDRLELFSPGGITNTMTIDSLSLRQSSCNEPLTSLLARCPLPSKAHSGIRTHIMDKRGEGVPIILFESEKLSGKLPVYRLLDDSELMLTIFAAPPPWEAE